jgi:hypothetical protein
MGPSDFQTDDSGTTYTGTWSPPFTMTYSRWVSGGFPHLFATAHLPGGSQLVEWDLNYCDDNASGGSNHLTFNLWDCDQAGICNPTPLATFNTTTQGAGCFAVGFNGGSVTGFTVNNASRFLAVEVVFGATDGSNRLSGSALGYKLQVSPAPVTASFNDVPVTDPAFQYIEALVAAGVTSGCGGGNYCPDNFLTRRQMAVFLAKALGLNWSQ